MLKLNFSSHCLLLSISLIGFVAGAAAPAQAGFEWVTPEMAANQGVSTVPPSASVPLPLQPPAMGRAAALDSSAPVVIDGASAPAASSHNLAAPSSASDKPLSGFADNVPLTVALRQILPRAYNFSLAQNIDAGTLVSWRGGASWHDTLSDMLHIAGLDMQEEGTMIRVVRAAGASAKSFAPTMPSSRDAGRPLPLGASALGTPLDQQYAAKHGGSASATTVPARTAASVPSEGPASVVSDAGGLVDTWTAEKSDTLRKVLEDWSRKAGVDLVWQAEYDFPLQASVVLSGTFEEAVRNLLSGFQDARPQPVGSLHNGETAGQSVLVIQTRGNNYSG